MNEVNEMRARVILHRLDAYREELAEMMNSEDTPPVDIRALDRAVSGLDAARENLRDVAVA